MKNIKFTPSFNRDFKKCRSSVRNFVQMYKLALKVFVDDPAMVNDHKLVKRNLKGLKAFSVTEDIRIVCQETKNFLVFLRVGSHEDVY